MSAQRFISRTIRTKQGVTYEIEDEIGSGGNCTVYKCYNVLNGDAYAVKVFNSKNNRKRTARFEQEVELLSQIEHDHIIKCFGSGRMLVEYTGGSKVFRNQVTFCILELATRNLREHLESQNWNIPYELYISQFRGLASALAKLHSTAIHRDIKLDNILVIGEKWVLADLGLCATFERSGAFLTDPDEPVGPRYFMSPEAVNRIVCKNSEIVAASDVYQMASVFWVVVNRSHPTGVLQRSDWSGPEHLYQLFYNCLAHNKNIRPADGIVFHAEIESAVNETIKQV